MWQGGWIRRRGVGAMFAAGLVFVTLASWAFGPVMAQEEGARRFVPDHEDATANQVGPSWIYQRQPDGSMRLIDGRRTPFGIRPAPQPVSGIAQEPIIRSSPAPTIAHGEAVQTILAEIRGGEAHLIEAKREVLRDALQSEFESNQKPLAEQIARLERELNRLRATMEFREVNRERIVERRMQELLGNEDPYAWFPQTNDHRPANQPQRVKRAQYETTDTPAFSMPKPREKNRDSFKHR